ncbi:aldo/keto reductase [Streptomyces justiciae]|uniref:aldo/keto reductase n=1 Tax=Streptomyces justiciae TaxID=2780140 RepID=UPI00188154DF|nr:aldo/keto reductase [Streptomyces justiciae]MBE8477572.1 aldo/keto reductase [Streptomyces justiciae]
MDRAGRSDGQVQSAVREVAGRRVWPVALGGAALSLRPDLSRETAAATINAAIDGGVNLIDTARAYTTADEEAHNERLIGDVLAARQDGSSVMVATKGGHFRAGSAEWRNDARPAALRADVERSLRALRRETVDLYFLHWPDAEVPFAESVGALGELRAEGKLRAVGVSNVDLSLLAAARTVTAIDAVQNPYSACDGGDDELLRECERHGIPFMAYSPLRGWDAATASPRLLALAADRGVSPQRLLLAWLLHRSPVLLPISGAGRPETATDSAAAARLSLRPDEVRTLDAVIRDHREAGAAAQDPS